ncbi:Hsp70 family protein [Streptomyces griseorubiginosus]|uniref:Hsp70 family protein n=1 Tax=Streptomyces griseorubiginosus TaxID=67304 RepID=UPI001AD6E1ED|nr:Hsp70 family protein [Streptomyces griseorubiginosus]
MAVPKVVVGIDFGTHGSGISWCTYGGRNDDPAQRRINFFNTWAGQPVASVKNLSALLVDAQGEVLAWGYEARRRALMNAQGGDESRYFNAFKMGLMEQAIADRSGRSSEKSVIEDSEWGDDEDEDEDENDDDVTPESVAASTGEEEGAEEDSISDLVVLSGTRRQNAESLIAAYLRKLYETALTQVTASGYDRDDIRWCLTVPAIWTDEQKQVMRDIAGKAGFPTEDGRLILALEPEAAAHYALVSGVKVAGGATDGASLMEPGSRFVVVDCGGGTVDLTAYETDAEGRMVEIGLPIGGPHGAEEINRAFRDEHLLDRFGKLEILQDLAADHPEALLDLTEAFERAKLHFGPGETDPIYLTLPTAIDRRIGAQVRKRLARKQNGVTDAIVVTADEARRLFDNVLPDVLDLIDEQLKEVENTATAGSSDPIVLLVGGFSASPMLQHAVKEHLKNRANVLVPPDPGAAVLYGAAHYAYEPHTRARRSRLTYGTCYCPEFEEGVDPEEYRFTLSTGEAHCRARFSKLVTRGDLVSTDDEAHLSYVPLEGTTRKLTFSLFSSTEPDPRYVTDPGCEYLGKITVDLKKVMAFALEDRGVTLYMSFGETEIKARAVVRESGEEAATSLRFLTNY